MTAPARRGVDEIRKQRRSREAGGEVGAPPLAPDVCSNERGDDQKTHERERPLKAHRRCPLRRKTASERNQSPDVESTTCRAPADASCRATCLRSSAAACAKRSRNRALRVSARTWRPVSGSTSQSTPAFGNS